MRRLLILILFLGLLLGSAYATDVNMFVFAVTEDGKGVPARLFIRVVPGTGHISVDVGESIVGESTQESVRNAIEAAADLAGVNWKNYDYYVQIISPSEHIDGPSAGLPLALSFYAAYENRDVPDYIGATGQIYPDGTVGPVGGVFEKAQAAHSVGVKIFLIPYGERNTTAVVEEEVAPEIVQQVEKTVDIVAYAKQEWNMDVYEVKTLQDAVNIVFKGKTPEVNVPPEEHLPLEQFNPPPAPVQTSAPFQSMAKILIQRAKEVIREAENCRNMPTKFKRELGVSLDTAKSMVKQAENLSKKGYYYTAANYAFLAVIDARVYREVCEHPSIIEPTSMAFQSMYDNVKAALESAREDLEDVVVGRENAEIVAAARERWIRAYMALQNQSLDIRTLISADEWIRAAEEMVRDANEPGSPLPDLENLARQWIVSAEDVTVQRDQLPPSVYDRIAWAREAYKRGWYLTAAMAAATARGLALGYIVAEQGDAYDTLARELKNAFEPAGIWDELYLNHARYYYEAAKYYKQAGASAMANDMATTGVEMYYMAKDLHNVLATLKKAPVVTVVEKERTSQLPTPRTLLLIGAIILLLSAIILLLARQKREGEKGRRVVKNPRIEHYEKKLKEVQKRLKQLEKKKKKTEEDKKEIMKLRRLAGRYRQLIEKAKAQ